MAGDEDECFQKMIYSRMGRSCSGSSLQRKEKTFYQRTRRVFRKEGQSERGKQCLWEDLSEEIAENPGFTPWSWISEGSTVKLQPRGKQVESLTLAVTESDRTRGSQPTRWQSHKAGMRNSTRNREAGRWCQGSDLQILVKIFAFTF